MASRKVPSLDGAIRQLVIDTLERYGTSSGVLRSVVSELSAVRRSIGTLERRLDKLSGRRTTRSKATGKRGPGRPPIHIKCTKSGCGRAHYARGLCSMHYQQWRRSKMGSAASSRSTTRKRKARKKKKK